MSKIPLFMTVPPCDGCAADAAETSLFNRADVSTVSSAALVGFVPSALRCGCIAAFASASTSRRIASTSTTPLAAGEGVVGAGGGLGSVRASMQ